MLFYLLYAVVKALTKFREFSLQLYSFFSLRCKVLPNFFDLFKKKIPTVSWNRRFFTFADFPSILFVDVFQLFLVSVFQEDIFFIKHWVENFYIFDLLGGPSWVVLHHCLWCGRWLFLSFCLRIFLYFFSLYFFHRRKSGRFLFSSFLPLIERFFYSRVLIAKGVIISWYFFPRFQLIIVLLRVGLF